MAPLIVLVHLLRRNNMSKHRLMSDLQSFDLEKAYCRKDFDQEFIHRAISEWYGSKDAFAQYVRGPLREELLHSSRSSFPPQYLVMVAAATVSASFDSLASLWLGGLDGYFILSEFVGNSIGFHVGWFLAHLKLLIFLCERFAAPIYPGLCDYAQSIMLFGTFFVLYYLGQTLCRFAYTSSLWGAVAWASSTCLLAVFAFSAEYQMQVRAEKAQGSAVAFGAPAQKGQA